MLDFGLNDSLEGQNREAGPVGENLVSEEDLLMEEILANINNTPIGQVLKKIASLPEVSQEKVLDIRHQLTEGKYEVNERLNVALDKVLEDLTA